MTPEQIKDAIRDVAEYDNWNLTTIYPFGRGAEKRWYHNHLSGSSSSILEGNEDEMQYHTSYDWLMPVAKKVHEEISAIVEGGFHSLIVGDIKKYAFDIDKLFPAVHKGVQFLNQHKIKATT